MIEPLIAEAGTRLLLVRHGETEWNREERMQGHHDVPLSARGVEQAHRLAAALVDEPLHTVYASDLQRAWRTAEILAGGRVPVAREPRVREAQFGEWEGLTTAEIRSTYPEQFEAWRVDSVRNRPPGGETLEDLWERCVAAVRDALAAHAGQTVAIVAHGGPVRVMVCGALGLPLEVYPRLRVENTALTRILFTARGPILAAFNDLSHLKGTGAAPAHFGWEEK